MPEINSNNSVNNEIYKNPYDDPLFLSNSECPSMKLSNTEFNGKNFNNWSRCVMLTLGAKNKDGFLDGSTAMPAITSPRYKMWMRCDYMIRCWILSSLSSELKEAFLSCKSAKQLWSDIVESYGQSNAPLLYQLKKKLRNIGQDQSSVAEYYNKLKRRWEEMEGFPECRCGILEKCSCNILKKIVESASKEKVMMFLIGLGDSYDKLRQNVLAMDPLPTINKVYSFVQQIESQKSISSIAPSAQDASALAVNKSNNNKGAWNVWKRNAAENATHNANTSAKPKDTRCCRHCKKGDHLIENCWHLDEAQKISYYNRHVGNGGPKFKKQRTFDNQYSANNAVQEDDIPFDIEYERAGHYVSHQHQHQKHEKRSSSKGHQQIDPDLMNAVCDRVLNVMQARMNGALDYSSASATYVGP